MKYIDSEGKFELEVSTGGNIVYETMISNGNGIWKTEDVERLDNAYKTKVYPLLKGKDWVKCSDLSHYRTSLIVPKMQEHIEWANSHGMKQGCIITDNFFNKKQIERSSGGDKSPLCPKVFLNKTEASDYLHSQGYKG